MSSRNKVYRREYEDKLHVKLVVGSSIHHFDWNHNNSKIKNLVAITQELHDKINIVSRKLPKACAKFARENVIKYIRHKDLVLIEGYLSVYEELLFYMKVKQEILQFGLQYVLIQYDGEDLEKIRKVYKEQ